MANCHPLFQKFLEDITVSGKRKEKLKDSRLALQDHLKTYFKNKDGVTTPRFRIQGSYIMGTMVQKLNDNTYDVDLGLYFLEKPTVDAATVQRYVFDAVKDWTDTPPVHKSKCIRVIYKGDYHIDIPVYYKLDTEAHPHLATKSGWEDSDPKDFNDWFKKRSDANGQMKRLVKYLKAWSDKLNFKSPSGLALTVWAAKYVQHADRDDETLVKLLEKMRDAIPYGFTCVLPVFANNDVTSKLDISQKEKFRDALKSFASDARKALDSKNQLEASKLWRKHLGDRFPEGEDKDVDAVEARLREAAMAAISGTAKVDRGGNIQTNEGVQYKPNRNFGG
jgi:hypothetical protein